MKFLVVIITFTCGILFSMHDQDDPYDFTIKPSYERVKAYRMLPSAEDIQAAVRYNTKYTDSQVEKLMNIVEGLLIERKKLQSDLKGLQGDLKELQNQFLFLKFQMIMSRSMFFLPPYNPVSADLLRKKPAVSINPCTKAFLPKQEKLDTNHQEKSSCEIF